MSLLTGKTPATQARLNGLAIVIAMSLGATSYWALMPKGDMIAGALAVTVVAAVLWITEALPLAVTALVIPVGLAVTGVFDESRAFASFGNPVLFLVLGGYGLGAAVAANGVDHWIAHGVLKRVGNRTIKVFAAMMTMSAVLSMFMSNTATTALLLPVAVGIAGKQDGDPTLAKLLMLGIAYGASIGGAATLVGSPPNAIVAGMLDIGFLQWMAYGLPVSIGMLACAIPLLWFTFRPKIRSVEFAFHGENHLSDGGTRTLFVTAVVIALWLIGPFITQIVGLPTALFSATSVACLAIALLIGTKCVSWSALERSVQWGVLLLLGGGLTLGRGLTESGAADWLGELLLEEIGNLPLLGLLFLIAAISVFATELISNTAVTAKLAPVLAGFALQLGLEAESLAVPAAIASSMAFMLPVATPPNAMVHASGLVTQKDMMRAGIGLNLTAVVVIPLLFYVMW